MKKNSHALCRSLLFDKGMQIAAEFFAVYSGIKKKSKMEGQVQLSNVFSMVLRQSRVFIPSGVRE